MGVKQTMIAIGIGCRKGCAANEIVRLVRETMALLPVATTPEGLFSIVDKRDEPGLAAAACTLHLPLVLLEHTVLRDVAARAQTRSSRVERMFGVPSIAETAALAGAGTGAVLLIPRRASAKATCAIAGPWS